MEKLIINETMKNDYIEYVKNRIKKQSNIKEYSYMTQNIISKTFDFFLIHKLTIENNAKSYRYDNGKKEIMCYGFSGCDINERINIEEMTETLYHEIFCKAEWLARGINSFYKDTVKSYFGNKWYNEIVS